jgi:hypothetical protein
MTCKARVFAGPGAFCNGLDVECQTAFCVVPLSNGSVPPSGTCPDVIPDGEPCQLSGAATCDTYATCAPPATDAGCCYVGGMGGSAGGPATFSDGGAGVPATPQNTCMLLDPSTCN